MQRSLISALIAAFFTGAHLAVALEPPIRLELVEVNKVWDHAPHNAFTDLIRFQDQWYLAFREATGHAVSGDGDVRVIRSTDGVNWESVALLDYGPEYDMRDAKLHITADNRLMLNTAAAPLAATNQRQSLVWFSGNGMDWSDGPYEIGQPDWWMWGVEVHPNGTVYGVGYGDIKTHPRTTRLYRSTDGIDYDVLIPTLTSDPETGETALLFRDNGTAVTLVRDNTGAERSLVGTATGDYTDWTFHVLDKRVGGPEIIELPDGNILAGSRLNMDDARTVLSWLDPDEGQLTPLLVLPSGGDTSYPGMVWHDDLLWTSYYSSHEDKTSIYLAQVRVVPREPYESPPAGTVHFQEENLPVISHSAQAANIRTDITEGESHLIIVGETAEHAKTLRGVFSFDLSALPEGTHIQEVAFTLFAERDQNDGVDGPSVDDDFRLELHRLNQPFAEGEVNWNERTAGIAWDVPGGDFESPPLTTLDANPYRLLSEGPSYTWQSTPELIQAAQDAFDRGESLDLLLRTPDGESQDGRVAFFFHSDDSGNAFEHPMLTVKYTSIPGDLNGDGFVGGDDLDIIRSFWGQNVTPGEWISGDASGDGFVGGDDLDWVRTHWGQGTPPLLAVPEPGTLVLIFHLLTFGLVFLARGTLAIAFFEGNRL